MAKQQKTNLSASRPSNEEIAIFLSKFAQLENLHNQFRQKHPRKYLQYATGELEEFKDFNQIKTLTEAADVIKNLDENILDLYKKGTKIPKVGKGVMDRVLEFSEKGSTSRFDALAWRYVGSPEIYLIPGFGFEKTRTLAQEEIWTLDQLRQTQYVEQIPIGYSRAWVKYPTRPPIGVYESDVIIDDAERDIKRGPEKPKEPTEKLLELVRVFEFPNLPSRKTSTLLKPTSSYPDHPKAVQYYAYGDEEFYAGADILEDLNELMQGRKGTKIVKEAYKYLVNPKSKARIKVLDAINVARDYWDTVKTNKSEGTSEILVPGDISLISMRGVVGASPVELEEPSTTYGAIVALPIDNVYLDHSTPDDGTIYFQSEETAGTATLNLLGENAGDLIGLNVEGDIDSHILKFYRLFILRIAAELLDRFHPGSGLNILDADEREKQWKEVVKEFNSLPPITEASLINTLLLEDRIHVDDPAFWRPVLVLDSKVEEASNADIAKYLTIWKDLEAIDNAGTPNLHFRLTAYQNASATLRAAGFELSFTLEGFEVDPTEPLRPQMAKAGKNIEKVCKEYNLTGIGKSIAEKIAWYLLTGSHPRYNELHNRYLPLVELMKVDGIGAATAKRLYYEKGIKSIEELWDAANTPLSEGGIDLPNRPFQWLVRYNAGFSGDRFPWELAHRRYLEFEKAIKTETAGRKTIRISPAGSLRRKRPDVKDMDIIIMGLTPSEISAICDKYGWKIVAAGEDKVEPVVGEIKADVIIVKEPEEWGAALTYLTGSRQFNIMMRDDAKRHGWILNQRGLFAGRTEEAPRVPGSETEEEIFNLLGWPWIPPENREPGKFETKVKAHLLQKQIFGSSGKR